MNGAGGILLTIDNNFIPLGMRTIPNIHKKKKVGSTRKRKASNGQLSGGELRNRINEMRKGGAIIVSGQLLSDSFEFRVEFLEVAPNTISSGDVLTV